MKFFVKLDLELDLKFEISDGKNLVSFWGTLLPARNAREILERTSGQISGKFSETSFQISRLFGNFAQQRGGVNS